MSLQKLSLADLCEVITKGTTPTTLGLPFAEAGVPFLRVQNLKDGHVVIDDEILFIDERTDQVLTRSRIKPGDVLLSIAGTIGRSAIVPSHAPRLNCNQAIAIIRPSKKILPSFLRYWLETKDAQQQMAGGKVTGTISNLSLTTVGNLKIPFLPFDEQCSIAAILDKAVALREKRLQTLAKFDKLGQAVFMEMFGDPRVNPHMFPFKRLAEVKDPSDCINYGVVQPGEHIPDGVPLIRVGDFFEGTIRIDSLKRISPHIDSAYKRSKLRGTEILVSCVGTIGSVSLASELMKGFNIARAVARIPVGSQMNRVFLAEYLRTSFVQQYFLTETRTVSQPTLNIKQIEETMVLCPPLQLQDEFASTAAKIDRTRKVIADSSIKMLTLFDSLLQRAFAGEPLTKKAAVAALLTTFAD